jgi:Domain of unknown function (DUF4192)
MVTNAINLRSPHELLAIVPFVLGFRPTNSLVVLCLSNHRLGLTQRLDLPAPEHADHAVSALMPSLVAENPDSVVLIGYENRAGASQPALESLSRALQSRSIKVHDRIVVRNGRWRSLDCDNPQCCPLQGARVPEPSDVPGIVAEFIGQGISPHPDREALARQLEAGPDAATVAKVLRSRQKAKAKGTGGPGVSRDELFAPWLRILDPEATVISAEDAAIASMSLLDIEIRDGLVAWLSPGTLNINELSGEVQELFCGLTPAWGEEHCDPASIASQNAVQDALIRLSGMLPDHVAAPALSVLASFAWWRGDGALARVALDRALRCEPDYRLARLLLQMVDLAISRSANPSRSTRSAANAAGLRRLRTPTSSGQPAAMSPQHSG